MHDFRIRTGTAVALGALFGVGTLAFGAGDANADGHTATLNVSALVDDSCSVSVLSHLDFGTYDPLNGNEASASVQLVCQTQRDVNVKIDGGLNKANELSSRRLSNGEHFLTYDISTNGQAWPHDNSNGWRSFDDVTDLSFAVDGVLDASGSPGSGGSFTDTLTVTIEPI
jgi:spore coat protein U-like protein